jgi:hypothetical protein
VFIIDEKDSYENKNIVKPAVLMLNEYRQLAEGDTT